MRFIYAAAAVTVYAVAMAYVEAAVVVDLNGALGQSIGVLFPIAAPFISSPLIAVEAGREAATIVMLAAVGILAGRNPWERLAWTAVAFGAWDLAYYGWLFVFTGWPPNLGTWDLLFLVPVPWAGPVWAPMAVSVALVVFGLVGARHLRGGGALRLTPRHVAAALGGGLLVVVSFTFDSARLAAGGVPASYPWPLLLAGIGLAAAAAADALRVRAAADPRGGSRR
jgi:hypothetical protein